MLEAYKLSSGSFKLKVDMLLHQSIIKFLEDAKVLSHEYFNQIDELLLTTSFYTSKQSQELEQIHHKKRDEG